MKPVGLPRLPTILASNNLSIKNIGIIHNREFEDGVLRLEMYDEESLASAVQLAATASLYNISTNNTSSFYINILQIRDTISVSLICWKIYYFNSGQYSLLASIISSKTSFATFMLGTVLFKVNASNTFWYDPQCIPQPTVFTV